MIPGEELTHDLYELISELSNSMPAVPVENVDEPVMTLEEISKKLNVTPEDNDMSKSLVKQADEERAKLDKLDGAAFDKAYAENEVAYHHTVNTALANTLIPSTTNQELKNLLTTGLKIFQGHEQHARTLASSLK